MNKFLALLSFGVVSIWRFRSKYIPLWLVYTCLVGFFSSVVILTSSLRREAQVLLSDKSPDIWVQRLAGGRLMAMDESFKDTLLSVRGVSKVVPRVWGYVFDSPTGALLSVMGIDSLPEVPYLSSNFGARLQENQVVCGTGILEMRHLEIGDVLTLENSEGKLSTFEIVGSFDSNADLLTRDMVIVSREQARQLLGYGKKEVTDFALYIPNKLEVSNIERKIARLYGGLRLSNRSQLAATYDAVFGWRGGLFTLGAIVSVMAFLVLVWEKSASFSSREYKESALLKALGWSVSDVLTIRLLEAMVISVSAAATGLIIGYWHVFVWDAVWIKSIISGWASLSPSYQLDFSLFFEDVVVVFVFAVLPYMAASMIPSWLSAVSNAEEALR